MQSESKEISVEPGSKIIGGKPGTSEGTLVVKDVTVDKPEECAVESERAPTGTVKMNSGHTEIVESEETHEPLILFAPKTGSVFVSILFLNNGTEVCSEEGVLANVTGSVLARPLPSLTETLNEYLHFKAPTKNFFLSNGALDKQDSYSPGTPRRSPAQPSKTVSATLGVTPQWRPPAIWTITCSSSLGSAGGPRPRSRSAARAGWRRP